MPAACLGSSLCIRLRLLLLNFFGPHPYHVVSNPGAHLGTQPTTMKVLGISEQYHPSTPHRLNPVAIDIVGDF
jgi:hypothetical protein